MIKILFSIPIVCLLAGCSGGSDSNGASGRFSVKGQLGNTDEYSDIVISLSPNITGSLLAKLVSVMGIVEGRPDSAGAFSIRISNGCYDMEVRKPGFRHRRFENICVNEANPEEDLGHIGLSIERRFVMTASVGEYVFMAGGYNADSMFSTVDVLNVNTGKMDVADISQRRARGVGVGVGSMAMFAGGEFCEAEGYSNCGMSSVVDVFDISTKQWSTASLSVARLDIAAGVTGDGYAVFAGGSAASGASTAVDIYNSNNGTWTTDVLPAARFGMSAIAVGNKVFFAGGSGPDSNGVTKTTRIDIFEPSTGTWSVQNLSVARRYFPTVKVGNKLFFAGGQLDCWPCLASDIVDIFDLDTEAWSTANLSAPRELLVGASDGVVAIFAGGEANGSQGMDTVDIFDSRTNSWSTSTISQARTNMAVAVNGGKAFFVGGNLGSHGFSNVIDVFNFETLSFSTSDF